MFTRPETSTLGFIRKGIMLPNIPVKTTRLLSHDRREWSLAELKTQYLIWTTTHTFLLRADVLILDP